MTTVTNFALAGTAFPPTAVDAVVVTAKGVSRDGEATGDPIRPPVGVAMRIP